MAVQGAQARITETVSGWQGVTAAPHRFGGTEFLLGKREIGHIHGDALVDIPFPIAVRDEVLAAGIAQRHHILPESGWVSLYLNGPSDEDRALTLLQRSYTIARAQQARRSAPTASGADTGQNATEG
jgi:hypothetical protein